jgi:RNA polymerase sigma factor FliA
VSSGDEPGLEPKRENPSADAGRGPDAEESHDSWEDYLVKDNLGLVYDLAQRMGRKTSGGPEREDLVSAGVSGLIQAARAFDPERGFAFSTLAVTRIRGAILDEIRRWDQRPRSIRKKERELRAAEAALGARLGRRPTPGELADGLDIDIEELHGWYLDLRQHHVESLDGKVPRHGEGDGASGPGIDAIAHDGVDPLEALERDEVVDVLTERLLSLPERDRQVLALSYYEGLKLREIGELLGVTESRVSQIRSSALGKLRAGMKEGLQA